jgi:hypothetical protein
VIVTNLVERKVLLVEGGVGVIVAVYATDHLLPRLLVERPNGTLANLSTAEVALLSRDAAAATERAS